MRLAVLAPLPAAAAERFPTDPSGRRGEPHVTVLCTETEGDAGVVREVVERVVAAAAPLDVELGDELVEFAGDDELRALALPVRSGLGLRLLRLDLRTELGAAGVETPQTFPTFEPHATLLYVPAGEQWTGERPAGAVRLDVVQLVIDGERTALPLAGGQLSAPPASARLAGDIDALRGAVRQRRKVSFTYTKDTGEQTTRTVRPIELTMEQGWTLAAFCELRQDYRTFRVHRMSAVQVLEDRFQLACGRPAGEQLRARPAGERVAAQFRALRFGQDLEAEAERRCAGVDVLEGWVVGKPFRTLATGQIFCRWSGKQRGTDITAQDLADAVACFESGEEVGIDKDHDTDHPDGTVLAMWVVDDGEHQSLAVVPAYGPRMAAYVGGSSGSMWSSPEVIWAEAVHDPRTGAPVGGMRIHSLAITANPAQAHRVLDRVRLVDTPPGTEDRPPPGGEGPQPRPQTQTEETAVDPKLEEMLAKIVAGQEAIAERVDKLEKGRAGDAGGEPKPQGEQASAEAPKPQGEQAAGAPVDEKMSATVKALEQQVARLSAGRDAAERDAYAAELKDRVTPALREGFNACWAKGGKELCKAVFGALPAGSAVPKTKGHGQAVEVTENDAWAQLDKAARERMSADKALTYDDATRLVLAEQRPSR